VGQEKHRGLGETVEYGRMGYGERGVGRGGGGGEGSGREMGSGLR